MDLHEYQSKRIIASYGLKVLEGYLCYTPGEVEAAADRLGGGICVVKAQVHAGGRGKGGGVKLAKNSAEARALGESIIGMTLVTPQTGPKGKHVGKVYVEAGCNIAKEFYLSVLVDRASRCISIVGSTEGGMDIEEVAEKHPEKIITVRVNPRIGFQQYQAVQLALDFGLDAKLIQPFAMLVMKLYEMFVDKDMAMLEINPLVLTGDGQFVVLDAKCTLDGDARYRHPELAGLMDYDEMDPRDLRAKKHGLNYVGLDGNIGCLANGAGLAMATMDIIKMYGGNPANFLDVGGGASKENVTEAFRLLLSDKNVKGILVNIFGGIMQCDVIAQAVIAASKELGLPVPMVVRLQGTNVEAGRLLLKESGLKIIPADTLDDAAKKIVEAVK